MTKKDRREFEAYVAACTDQQVLGVWEKEKAARRHDYAAIAVAEALRRGLKVIVAATMSPLR